MDRMPFKTLARLVHTLAVGRAVTLPFAPGGRGFEWADTFVVGPDHANGGETVMHRMTTRKNGVEREQMASPCDWSLDEMLQQIVEWDDETLDHVERNLMPLEDPGHTVEAIADLTDGPGVAMIAGTLWRREGDAIRMTTEAPPKWTLDEAVTAVKAGR